MNPTPEEASASLQEIENVVRNTRRNLGHGVAAPLLILWGVIWILGYGISQFRPELIPISWPALATSGGLLSWFIGTRASNRVRGRSDGKFGLVWLILFLFAALWISFFLPVGLPAGMTHGELGLIMNRKIGVFLATVPMLAYVVAGLWLGRFLTCLGIFVTLVVAMSYFLVPEWCMLITGLMGGGSLVLSGIFVRQVWR